VDFILAHRGKWAWPETESIEGNIAYHVNDNSIIVLTIDGEIGAVLTASFEQAQRVVHVCNAVAINKQFLLTVIFILAKMVPGWHLTYDHHGKSFRYDSEGVVKLLTKLSYGWKR